MIAAFSGTCLATSHAVLEDANLVGEDVHIEDTATRGVGDAVEIAADAHYAAVQD